MDVVHCLSSYRFVLVAVGTIGLVALNGAFLYYALAEPAVLLAAMANSVGLVFILEAFLLMGLLTWVIARPGLHKPGWLAFVLLSLVDSLAFSVPWFLLWHLTEQREEDRSPTQPSAAARSP